MWFWLKISIRQSSMVHKGSWVNCPTKVGNLEASTVCWTEATPQDGTMSGNRAVLDCVRRVALEDLVLSQEDKPKRHRWAHEISHETAVLYSSVHRKIIHGDLQLTCFERRRAHAAVVWSQSCLPSHSLINNFIVCSKSCYCYIINGKLNNK